MQLERWKTIGEEYIGNFKIFDLYYKDRIHPVKNTVGRFVSLKSPDWVNIVALTSQKEFILVEQYRHGSDSISLELPAGLIEPQEFHQIAAERECTEETGYVGKGKAELLGAVEPNPAFQGNLCYHYLWLDCEKKYEQMLDENELINVRLVSIKDMKELIRQGLVRHSLVMSALFHFSMKYNEIWNH